MNILMKTIDFLDDYINPIVVKELRQMARGKFLWSILILFLFIQSISLTAAVLAKSATSSSTGRDTLSFLMSVLALACYAIIPLYASFRFGKERLEKTDELLQITTITPHTIIKGKFFAAFAFVLTIISAFAPFLSMTFFLRGVDMPVVFFTLLILICCSAMSIMFQLCLACISTNSGSFNLVRGVSLIFQIITFFYITAILSESIRYGRIYNQLTFFGFFSGILIFFLITYLLYLASSAVISPSSSNRSYPIRRFVTKSWLALLVLTLGWKFISTANSDIIVAWGIGFTMVFSTFFFIVTSERDKITPRVARGIPDGFVNRIPYFLLSSGVSGGLTWSILMQFLTVIITLIFLPSQHVVFLYFGLGIPFYSLTYSLSALFIRRSFISKYIEIQNTWVVALVTVMIMMFFPVFIGAMISRPFNSFLIVGSPFSLSTGSRAAGMIFSGTGAFIFLLLNANYLSQQMQRFFTYKKFALPPKKKITPAVSKNVKVKLPVLENNVQQKVDKTINKKTSINEKSNEPVENIESADEYIVDDQSDEKNTDELSEQEIDTLKQIDDPNDKK